MWFFKKQAKEQSDESTGFRVKSIPPSILPAIQDTDQNVNVIKVLGWWNYRGFCCFFFLVLGNKLFVSA